MTPPRAPDAEATLRPPPVFTPGVVASLVVGILVLVLMQSFPGIDTASRVLMVTLVASLALGPLILSWRLHNEAVPRVLSLFPDRLVLPIGPRATQRLRIELSDVTGIVLHERSHRGFLLIGTSSFDFMYPLDSFRAPGEVRAFVEGLRERLRTTLPHGERTVASFEVEGARSADALLRRPVALYGLLGLMALTTVVLGALGGFDDAFASVGFGALSRPLVLQGEWFRVLSYPFVLSASLAPPGGPAWPITGLIYGVALFVLGRPLEQLLGPWVVLGLFVAGSVFGGLFVLPANDAALLHGYGAAVFAFVGAAAFLSVQVRDRLPLGFRLSLRYWFWASVLASLVLVSPDTSFDAALGGLFGGVVVIAPFTSAPLPLGSAPSWLRAFGMSGLVVMLGGFAWATQSARVDGEVMGRVLAVNQDAERLNHYAWGLAIDPDATPTELELAAVAANRSHTLSVGTLREPAVADTWATVLYRQGRHDRAVDLQLQAFDAAETDESNPYVAQASGVYASQLARFMLAEATASSTTAAVALDGGLLEDGRVRIRPEVHRSAENHRTVFGVIHDGAAIRGLVRVALPPGPGSAEQTVDLENSIEWTESTRITVARVTRGRTTSKAWAFSESVAQYP